MKKIGIYVDSKIVYVDFKRTNNKNAYIKVTRDNKILVTAPLNMDQKHVELFVSQHIKKFLNYINKAKSNQLYSLKEKFIYLQGKKMNLEILTGFSNPLFIIKNKTAYLKVKSGSDEECILLINNYLKDFLYSYIAKQQKVLEIVLKAPVHKIKISNKTSTWGSNNLRTRSISYALRLGHFSPKVIDYIIIHELAHFSVGDHSSLFWSVVKNAMPDYKKYQNQLKEDEALLED